jgi:small subunit ribosomal protein S1
VRLLDDGVVVDMGDEIEGFVPRSQVPIAAGKDLSTVVGEGQTMGVRILECDAANHRIVLTVTQMPEPPAKRVEPEAASGESEAVEAGEAESGNDAGESPKAEIATEAPADEVVEAPADEVVEAPAAEAVEGDEPEPDEAGAEEVEEKSP